MTVPTLQKHVNCSFSWLISLVTLAVLITASPAIAKDAHWSGKKSHVSGHSGVHHAKYSRHNYGHNYSHNYNRNYGHSYGHHYYGTELFIAGLFSGYGSHYLINPYRYYDRNVYVTQPTVTIIREFPTVIPTRTVQEMANCLQTREYQTVVTVGGREIDAYGTACLQPDGSWLRGPTKLPPEF